MTLSSEDLEAASRALRDARVKAGLPPLIDDETTLRMIAAVMASHVKEDGGSHE